MSTFSIADVLNDAIVGWCRSCWWRGTWAWLGRRARYGGSVGVVRVFRLGRGGLIEFRLCICQDCGYHAGSMVECVGDPAGLRPDRETGLVFYGVESCLGVTVFHLEDPGSVDQIESFVRSFL